MKATGGHPGNDVGQIAAWSLSVAKGEATRVMDAVLKKAADEGESVLVLDGGMVFGSDHLASALYHARKAVGEGRNASDSLQMEVLLYSSGERQLSTAIDKMGVGEDTTVVVVARISDGPFVPGEGWVRLPRRPERVDPAMLERFGIGRAEVETAEGARIADLVLERVANVDLIKR